MREDVDDLAAHIGKNYSTCLPNRWFQYWRCIVRMAAIMCGAIALSNAMGTCAQDYPTRVIHMVVPGTPGGSADILARMVGAKLYERWGQPVVTENRSGASQMIGAEYVAKSAPDGHTLLLATISYTTTVAIRPSLPFDPIKDVAGITMVGQGPLLLVVHPSLPVKSVSELIAMAKARPGYINYASPGNGTIPHLVAEVFAGRAQINIVHVPYKAIAAAVTDTVGGHVPMMFTSLPAAWSQVQAQRLRALAVTTGKRSEFVPDLPTIAEAGVAGFDASTWWGLFTQGRTPNGIIAKLNAEMQKIIVAEDVKARLKAEGALPVPGMTADAFGEVIRNEIAMWRKIVKERNLSGES
jgi:tripartite-type tricarboxylate transporter receptor subunit TctC